MPSSTLPADVTTFKDSIKNKMNFMEKVFIAPYFEEAESAALIKSFGINQNISMNEGILRISYNAPSVPASPPTSTNELSAIFNSGNLTKDSHTILASLNESSYIPGKGYVIYDYMGSLYVPEAGGYTFTANTTGHMDVYINYTKQLSLYGNPSLATDITNSTAISLDMGTVPINIRFYQRGASGDQQAFKLQWRKSADPVSSNEILGCTNLYYDSSLINRDTPDNKEFDKNDYITNLMDYSVFKKYFGIKNNALVTVLGQQATYNEIHIATGSSNYKPFECSGASPNIPTGELGADGNINGDVNYNNFLTVKIQGIKNANAIRELLKVLNEYRSLYNALSDDIYERIKNNETDVLVSAYTIDSSTNRPTTIKGTNVIPSNILALFEKVTPVERFVFRRLVLLVDLVIHAHISMFLFENVYGTSIPCITKIADMLSHFIMRIKTLNERYDRIFQSPPANTANLENEIMANLYENIHAFNRNSATMGKLTKDFKESKVKLKANLRSMESEKALYSSGNKWTMAFLIITVIVILTVVAYSILSNTNPAYKWVGAATVSATSALTVLLIYLIKSKKMETFTTGDVYNPSAWRDAISTARAIDVIQEAYQYDMMREIQAYVQNTIHMALILQNSKTYNYINHTVQKEINYYSASKQQVDNAKTLAKASTRMYNLETRNNLSRVNVYIALIIILTFAIVGYRLSGDSALLKYIVLGVSAVLLLMVALLYIIDVERKVRTDGRKIYWGQPNDMLAKL